jgi:Chaperone of endosialidase
MKTLTKFIYLAFTTLVLACFALLPRVQAAPDPSAPPASNTRDGQFSLAHITTGLNNSAFGTNALNKLTIGNNNAAQGNSAQFSLTDGGNNTALGVLALRLNVHGDANTAVGRDALYSNTNDFNVAVGYQALRGNTGGAENTAVGVQAGSLLTTGSLNINIGSGVSGPAGESNTIRIGDNFGTTSNLAACFIGGIYNQVASGGTPVYVNSAHKLGTGTSSRRYKDEIKPMDKASEAILALKPVTFFYKKEIEPQRVPQFGLIAEEVEKVNPNLVGRDAKGEVNTVRYEAVNAMLLNEFLKEHKTVQEQKATIAQLKQNFESKLAEQQKQIEALTAGLQKVSAQIEVSKPGPRTVVDNR